MFALLATLWTGCSPTGAWGSSYSCTGIAYGLKDSSMEVRIERDSHDADRAIWTPMHWDNMPFFIRLTYGVNSGRLGRLKEARAEVESLEPFGKSYALLQTDITTTPPPDSTWRVTFPASRNESLRPGNQTRIWRASAIIASTTSSNLFAIHSNRHRIAVLWAISDLNFEYHDGSGSMVGHEGSYSLSNPFEPSIGMRASLFPVAYGRAIHGLQSGCASADSMCECSDG
jgi:hypothetical protein